MSAYLKAAQKEINPGVKVSQVGLLMMIQIQLAYKLCQSITAHGQLHSRGCASKVGCVNT